MAAKLNKPKNNRKVKQVSAGCRPALLQKELDELFQVRRRINILSRSDREGWPYGVMLRAEIARTTWLKNHFIYLGLQDHKSTNL